jgi:hypothetical protein
MAENSINRISGKNILLAFLVSPLLTPATFYFTAAFTADSRSGINDPVSLFPMVFGLYTPFAYLATLIIGLPAFLIYRKLGWERLVCYSTGGAAMGLLTALLLFNFAISWSVNSVDYVWCALAGAVSATFFWVALYKV